jgi:hypothetical protein
MNFVNLIRFLCLLGVCLVLFFEGTNGQTYNYYFGTLHAHSGYSDGNKDSLSSGIYKPFDDFQYAKESQEFDFLGISEHNHLSAGLQLPNYHLGIQQADLANEDEGFVCLYGMEWGVINSGGHLIVYGFDSLIGWEPGNYDIYNAETDYHGLFEKVASKPGAFSYLAHPQSSDYDNLFQKPYDSLVDKAVSAIPFRSGPAFSTSTSYDDPANGTYLSKFYTALSKGYHVGICIDHDTHNTVFGRSQAGRTGILARNLTQQSVMEAYKNMNIYATDDWNAQVDFRVNGEIMGSVFAGQGQPEVTVNYVDPDGEGITQMWLYDGTPGSGLTPNLVYTIYQFESFSFTPDLANGETKYYFIKVEQTDGDQLFTSPIWYTRNDDLATEPRKNTPQLQIASGHANEWVNINLHANTPLNGELQILNLNGKLMFATPLSNTTFFSKSFSRALLGTGLFLVNVSGTQGLISKKFVLE